MPAGAWGHPQERGRSLLGLMPRPQGLRPLPDRFVEHGGRGGRDVQRFDMAAHREADQAVAALPREVAEAVFLAAQAEHDLAGEIDLPRRIAGGVGAVDPEPVLLELGDGHRRVRDALDREPLGRPGGGLGHRGRDRGGTPVADHHLPHPRAFADAEYGAEVPRVLDVFEQDAEVRIGRGSLDLGRFADLRHQAVVRRAGERRELALRYVADLDPVPKAELGHLVAPRPGATSGDEDALDVVRPVP